MSNRFNRNNANVPLPHEDTSSLRGDPERRLR